MNRLINFREIMEITTLQDANNIFINDHLSDNPKISIVDGFSCHVYFLFKCHKKNINKIKDENKNEKKNKNNNDDDENKEPYKLFGPAKF